MPLVTNTLRDPAGNPLEGVSVQIRLITGDRPDQPGWAAPNAGYNNTFYGADVVFVPDPD